MPEEKSGLLCGLRRVLRVLRGESDPSGVFMENRGGIAVRQGLAKAVSERLRPVRLRGRRLRESIDTLRARSLAAPSAMDAADDATDEINGRSDQPPDDAAPAGPLPASRASLVLPTPALSADLRAPQDAPPALSSLLIRPPRPRSIDDDDDDEENRVVETDPTGRFSRYAKRLGKGAYKEVYKAYDEDEGVEVAWNQLRVDHLGSREAKRILSEIQILKSMRSENVITMYHAWCAKGADNIERVYFITELMTSSLKTYLKKTSKAVVGKILKKWCRQILQGLCYLHSRTPPIIH
ncbi:Serine/threonine-protein kinase wnk3, partial [Entophlyctis luteolus]